MAFIAPGFVSIAVGLLYLATAYRATEAGGGRKGIDAPVTASRSVQIRVIAAIAPSRGSRSTTRPERGTILSWSSPLTVASS